MCLIGYIVAYGPTVPRWLGNKLLDLTLGKEDEWEYQYSTTPS